MEKVELVKVAESFLCFHCEEEFPTNDKKFYRFNFMLSYCQNMPRKSVDVCPYCYLFLDAEGKSEYEYVKVNMKRT